MRGVELAANDPATRSSAIGEDGDQCDAQSERHCGENS